MLIIVPNILTSKTIFPTMLGKIASPIYRPPSPLKKSSYIISSVRQVHCLGSGSVGFLNPNPDQRINYQLKMATKKYFDLKTQI